MGKFKFEIGKLVEKKLPRNKYKLTAMFEDIYEEAEIITQDIKYLELIIMAYKVQMKQTDEDENRFFYPDSYDIEGFINEAANELNYEANVDKLIYDAWVTDERADCYGRVSYWELTYFDANGLEFEVNIKEEI